MVAVRGWVGMEENRELLFTRYKISVLQNEKTSGDECWQWLYNIVNILNTANCTLRNG